MVAGTGWPDGDPFLQRQNEPSIAVSTRNPLHLLAGANDYRTVDLPGLEDIKVIGDAWNGIFRSYDGGNTWTSTLLPGYPQDNSPEGLASPLKGYAAGADPVVRAGASGLFYYAGIVLNRDENPLGAFFVARYLDHNDKEAGHSIRYVDTQVLQKGTSGQFNDKPWLAVDIPRPGQSPCTVAGRHVDGGNVYAAWTILVGGDENIRSKMMLASSEDCGATWPRVTKLSESHAINQGAALAIDPISGAVYVAWRRITNGKESDAILFAKSTDFGKSFTKAMEIASFIPFFEQGTTGLSFRTTAFPSMAVDGNGHIYVVWSQRNGNGDGRVIITSSSDGTNWSAPSYLANHLERGHQFMPSIAFAQGKLTLAWYDQREDHTAGIYSPIVVGGKLSGQYSETREKKGHLALDEPEKVFNSFIQEIAPPNIPLLRRHTLDVFVGQADPGIFPVFQTARASQYWFGTRPTPAGNTLIEQMQFSPPNLPLFRQGTVPFIGDYLDVAALSMNSNSAWQFNTAASRSPIFHLVWTDNRDVRPPLDGNWRNYTPVGLTASGSIFDPSVDRPPCQPGQAGMRNQNIYTTRVTAGLFAGSPGNSKPFLTPLGQRLQRAFVVFVQNTLKDAKTYRLTIMNQPEGGKASFLQFAQPPLPDPLTILDVTIPARSTVARSVFATSMDKYERIDVRVEEITAPGGAPVTDGLETTVVLNPDIANPDIANPDIANPDIANPDIANAEVYNPDIANPDIANPDIANPDIANPDIANPDIANPDIANPDIANPDIANPDIANPDIANPDIANGSVTDTTWETTNKGNTTASYSVNLLLNGQVPESFKLQLILHRIYTTPIAHGCTPALERHTVLSANINNPRFTAAGDLTTTDVTDGSEENATIWLLPGETMRITLRVVDPNRFDDITFNAAEQVTPVTVAHAVNTLDLAAGVTTPPVSLAILTSSAPDAVSGDFYEFQLEAVGGVGTKTWKASGVPAGFSLSSSGLLSGSSTTPGSHTLNVTVTDSREPVPESRTRAIPFRIVAEDLFIPAGQSLPVGEPGMSYSATLQAEGGVEPYSWFLNEGSSLASGLTLSPQGVISGTPTQAGTRFFSVTVQDSSEPDPQTANDSFSISIPGSCALPLALDTGQNASKWFGGDDREGFAGRNVGTGQSIIPTRDMMLTVVEVPIDGSHSGCTTLNMRLELRDASGVTLSTDDSPLPCGIAGRKWVVFDIPYGLAAGQTYNLTWWLTQGSEDQLEFSSPAVSEGFEPSSAIPCGQGLAAQNNEASDLSGWASWFNHPWDFFIRIQATTPAE